MKFIITKKINWVLLISLVVGIFAVIYLLVLNPMVDKVENVYSTDKLEAKKLSRIKFRDVTKEWGLEYNHYENSTRKRSSLAVVYPSVLIYDFDKNGLMDIFYSGGKRNYLYLNMGNQKFVEAAESFGLIGRQIEEQISSMAIMADLNGDGEADLYLAASGKHRLFFREKGKNFFQERSELLHGYSSFPESVNVLDFNKDGLLDVVVGNFIELGKVSEGANWYLPRRYGSTGGGENHLLLQTKNGDFKVSKEVDFISQSFTHAIGISDINNDGWPDIFFANDYAKDEMFLNEEGRTVRDVTQQYIPKVWHGNSGMNAEFMDFNQDGLIDLYVTYIHKPPFYRAYNILWQKKANSEGFDPVSWDKNIGRCGFSWGAKFADFNLDGELDLFVVNGRDKNPKLKKAEDGKSFWYARTQLTSMPGWLLGYMSKYEKNSKKSYYNSAFERDCLFIQDKGEFFDVAADIGLTDAQEGRGLALADLNNDGLMDIIVTNYFGTSKVYLNESTPIGSWIGFSFYDKNGSDIPIGAFIKLKQSHGPDLVREYYPANGYRGQSDPRIVFGLPKGSTPVSLEVTWPLTKKKIIYNDFKEKQYNSIFEIQKVK